MVNFQSVFNSTEVQEFVHENLLNIGIDLNPTPLKVLMLLLYTGIFYLVTKVSNKVSKYILITLAVLLGVLIILQ